MSRILYVPKQIAENYTEMESEGDWIVEEDLFEFSNLYGFDFMKELDKLKSDKVKDLITRTINKELQWEFTWCWFTGGSWFPLFMAKKDNKEYRAQVAFPPKEWGYIIVVTSSDGYFYDSIMDDEEYPEVGMELWHLIEGHYCTNPEYLEDELRKRHEADEKGEQYPEVPKQ